MEKFEPRRGAEKLRDSLNLSFGRGVIQFSPIEEWGQRVSELQVLLVEDDYDAATLMLRALEKVDSSCVVQILTDGVQAIEYLASGTIPSVVVTDLKMPRKNGFDVIAWIRSRPALADLPVFVLSCSKEQADIDQALKLGATAYFEKPLSLTELLEIARTILSRSTPELKKK